MEACQELKKNYDECFNNWFTERFMKGHTDDSICAPLLKVYKECVQKSMKEQNIELKDIEINHLGTENEKKSPS
ncbi:TP53-regulated inhibitor of apoptosis 1-like isoform X2 [Fopius arisanus]|uniref:TP53-regulated inhibitor of apoptosis 1-like isoform X2 n=1 Tax=Fopius arisanus TaxID=64838 RepID=A0A9R1TG16_9HYME|nr:PREDICTED: TP53-regulated inhibitor of apoptosis 1-like isoform X2 [Fopius arisanus]XP_011308650.1 PREDICTED: TP53-regulated inhibitor of apoptosis 1-like isoform X2 [Fopius arisanus]